MNPNGLQLHWWYRLLVRDKWHLVRYRGEDTYLGRRVRCGRSAPSRGDPGRLVVPLPPGGS
jgi:hypothetical protein